MAGSNFDELLNRYLSGKTSPQETVKLDAWLDAMGARNTRDLRLSEQDEELLFQKITAKVDNLEEVRSFRTGKTIFMNVNWRLFRVAASVLLVALAGYVVWDFSQQDIDRMASGDDIEKKILSDGTIVWLQDKSALVYYEKISEGIRYAEMNGAGLFEVAKDAAHPFIIKYNQATIRVVGTSFHLRTSNDSLELRVLTGRVNLSTESNRNGVMIEPNERARYTLKNGIEKFSLTPAEVAQVTAGTEYNMKFSGAKLGEVMERMEKKFNVTVEYKEDKLKNCRITADFTDRSLESTMEMIADVLNVSYNRSQNTITLNGPGCD